MRVLNTEQILKAHLDIWQNIAIELAEENDMLHAVNNEWWRAMTVLAEFYHNQLTKKPTKQNNQYVKNDASKNRSGKRG